MSPHKICKLQITMYSKSVRNTDNLTLSSYVKMRHTKIEDAYKICSQCKIKKSHDNFYADWRIKDGKRSQCVDCHKSSNYRKIKCECGKEIASKVGRCRKTTQHMFVTSVLKIIY